MNTRSLQIALLTITAAIAPLTSRANPNFYSPLGSLKLSKNTRRTLDPNFGSITLCEASLLTYDQLREWLVPGHDAKDFLRVVSELERLHAPFERSNFTELSGSARIVLHRHRVRTPLQLVRRWESLRHLHFEDGDLAQIQKYRESKLNLGLDAPIENLGFDPSLTRLFLTKDFKTLRELSNYSEGQLARILRHPHWTLPEVHRALRFIGLPKNARFTN